MGNGTEAASQMIGDVKGLVYSKKNKKGFCATLTDVAHAPTAKYNLFSLTCMLRKGLKMNGNSNGIVLTKGKHTLNFDHKVETRWMHHARTTLRYYQKMQYARTTLLY